MGSQGDIWEAMRRGLSGQWTSLTDIYLTVREEMGLAESEMDSRLKRNVRNVLQRKKTTGEVAWDGHGKYRLPGDSAGDDGVSRGS